MPRSPAPLSLLALVGAVSLGCDGAKDSAAARHADASTGVVSQRPAADSGSGSAEGSSVDAGAVASSTMDSATTDVDAGAASASASALDASSAAPDAEVTSTRIDCSMGPVKTCGLGATGCVDTQDGYTCTCGDGYTGTGGNACTRSGDCAALSACAHGSPDCIELVESYACKAVDISQIRLAMDLAGRAIFSWYENDDDYRCQSVVRYSPAAGWSRVAMFAIDPGFYPLPSPVIGPAGVATGMVVGRLEDPP